MTDRCSRRLPPGPRGLPLIGYIPFVGQNLAKKAKELSVKFETDLIFLWLGPTAVTFLNTYSAIKDAFVKNGDQLRDRPEMFFKKFLTNGKGILGCDGEVWKQQRRFTLSVMKDFGMGKYQSEQRILDEVQNLIEHLQTVENCPVDIHHRMTTATSNIISSVVFGKRHEYGDRKFSEFMTSLEWTMGKVGFFGLLNYLPWLRHCPGDPLSFRRIQRVSARINEFIREQIDEHRTRFCENRIEDFIDAYLQELNRTEKSTINGHYNEQQMVQVIRDMFVAGTETTAITLRWTILYMCIYPHIQQKVHEELEEFRSNRCNEFITMSDSAMLPYTRAVLMESQRFATIMPFGVPHANNTRDVTLGRYDIPRGTIVMANIWAVHNDAEIWNRPEQFDPSHFLDKNGQHVNEEFLIPFLIGKRACLGESLAKMALFLFFTNLMNQYKFRLLESAADIDLNGLSGVVKQPPFHRIIVTKRHNNELHSNREP
ncbi:cytochrome P450 2U1-like [Tubulanus polymorphus]|uniref:cytochrome P450 2U1-like n=1 Tax=Tubulanus polymorphus TaxID=672921 RepID=UPI003DA29703